jgi:hypothetical protein
MMIPKRVCVVALIGLAVAVVGPAAAETKSATRINCFWARQWGGWSSPSPDVIYLRVNLSDYYKVGLSSPSTLLRDSTFHLRSVNAGTDSICTPSDLRLEINNFHGVSEPLFPVSIVKLTDEEVKAIPPADRPH